MDVACKPASEPEREREREPEPKPEPARIKARWVNVPEDSDSMVAAVMSLMDKLANDEITREEFEAAKTNLFLPNATAALPIADMGNPQPQPQPQPEPEPEAVPPPSPQQVRQRLVVLGQHASIEVSPAQAGAPTAPGATPLKYTLASALDGAARPPLPPGATCFVNMVKTQEAHFSDVIAAVNALTRRGILPVPHVPACRFDSEGAVVSFLILHG